METSCKNGPSQTPYGNLTAREPNSKPLQGNLVYQSILSLYGKKEFISSYGPRSKHIPPGEGTSQRKRKATGSQAFGHELPKAGPGSSLKPALTREPIISYPNLLGKLLPNTIPLCSYRALSLLQHKGTQTRYSLLPPRKNANYYNGTRGKHPLN